ncbi:hypothetical protein IGW_05377 [Bacillus cereus ISP3191]|uniref:hypothetical protein n=1 Tax=Bacillus cereus TaxID=1396 RepID=UPI00027956E7|nr:hypothetical protein [Bacillus cereus]EJQ86786.1 hypothetical protein IGW_05377 [Bacillus cereus ISP3191]
MKEKGASFRKTFLFFNTISKVVETVADIEETKNLEETATTTTTNSTVFDEVAKYVKEHKKLTDNYIA